MRQTRDPYRTWLSEVIFQQTRINQGLPYYHSFLKAFPDLLSLARAGEDEVLKVWQGLGYYSRARNMHLAAKHIITELNGVMPDSSEGLLKLKGIGSYTASAIASWCYGEPCAAVDGNVSRVISRLFGVEEAVNSSQGANIISAYARDLLDELDPGTHNQAMIDFGAMQCVPRSPDCNLCPLRDCCQAWLNGQVHRIPVKTPARKPVEQWIYYYIFICRGETIITRRSDEDIWKSLYQFPVAESEKPLEDARMVDLGLVAEPAPVYRGVTIEKISDPVKHQLTHRTIMARFIHVRLNEWPDPMPVGWIKISMDQLDDYPVSRLINRYMEVVKI